ncbi:hypothetical protein N7462_008656 [Penicillium macrosclerotiorum]|uniref:uncharacterized protein n=1 Tax=Penicillium macrosclerotiorum TaxID=303699 RepID=UPI0025490001|nr:uncharacterized protein N7462_008656 [Penicillium macrosclerotiorum]KAJ5675759.1 hypothetical protein N7462_008656 [Penicillium macrosclerotiorum]
MGSYKARQDRSGSGGSSSSTETDASGHSKSTAPTVFSEHTVAGPKYQDWPGFEYIEEPEAYIDELDTPDDPDPRDSVSTYASTTRSTTKVAPEEPRYEVDDRQENFMTDALASTPASFAGLFPSSRRLLIRHDDATLDGNMNLRVDTVVPCRDGYQQDVILFHLRMHDLFSRRFSLRRYCRDSGREVCHSTRREAGASQDRRPVFRRSWSSMLASLRPGSSGGDVNVEPSTTPRAGDPDDEGERTLGDTMLLEFSNYAHVEVKRRGPGATKRYEYEYWGSRYQWRREFRREGDLREVSYYLVDTRTSRTIAHLVPDILTPLEAVEEESKGGWVPPSSLWINDPSVYERMPDVADVIVATGLATLVDDCIRRRWHHDRRPWNLPARSSFTRSLERMGPRRLIGEVLQRRGSA